MWFIPRLKAKLLQETGKEYSSLPSPIPSLFAWSFVIHFICFVYQTPQLLYQTHSAKNVFRFWIWKLDYFPPFFCYKTSKTVNILVWYIPFPYSVCSSQWNYMFSNYNLHLITTMWTKFDPQVFNLIHNNSTPSLRHGDVSGIRLKPNRHARNPVLMNKGSTIMLFALWCIIFLFLLKLIFKWAIEASNILFFRDNETDFWLCVSVWSW